MVPSARNAASGYVTGKRRENGLEEGLDCHASFLPQHANVPSVRRPHVWKAAGRKGREGAPGAAQAHLGEPRPSKRLFPSFKMPQLCSRPAETEEKTCPEAGSTGLARRYPQHSTPAIRPNAHKYAPRQRKGTRTLRQVARTDLGNCSPNMRRFRPYEGRMCVGPQRKREKRNLKVGWLDFPRPCPNN